MLNNRIKTALVMLAASAGLAGCTSLGGPYGGVGVGVGTSPYGYGYGNPYGYGYGSPYGSPYGYNGYGYYDPYSRYYASYPYYGWNNGYYYPGSGYWVYDRYGNRHPLRGEQKSYWSSLLAKVKERAAADGVNTTTAAVGENWSGFGANAATATTPQQQKSLNTIRRRMEAQRQRQVRAQQSATVAAQGGSVQASSDARLQAQAERQQARAEQRTARIERQEAQRASVRERALERRRSRESSDQ